MPRLSFHQSGLWRHSVIAAAGQGPDPSGQVLSAQHEVSTTENPPAQNLICRNHNIARKQSIHICLFAVPFWPFLRFLRSFALGPLFYLIFIHPLSALSEAGLMTLEPSPCAHSRFSQFPLDFLFADSVHKRSSDWLDWSLNALLLCSKSRKKRKGRVSAKWDANKWI